MSEVTSTARKPLVHISRRSNISKKTPFLVKGISIVAALLACGLFSALVSSNDYGNFFFRFINFYVYIYEGTLFTPDTILATIWNAGILLLIAAAITPAFKMKFWNIGAEGQVLMGALGAAIIMKFVAPSLPNYISIFLMLVAALIGGAIWTFIPAIFKALFNTNETLFTLMMNYVAVGIVASFSVRYKAPSNTALGVLNQDTRAGWLPTIGGYNYIINIIVIILLVIFVWGYLKYSKQGYEISVLNGSQRTAEYVGINVKVTTIRTLILNGLLCGVAGFLIVAGASHTVSETVVGGRGFTAVMISWLGHFNPLAMTLYAVLNSIISDGGSNAAGNLGYSGEISKVLSGFFFLVILSSEFFINFKIKINLPKKKKELEISKEGGK